MRSHREAVGEQSGSPSGEEEASGAAPQGVLRAPPGLCGLLAGRQAGWMAFCRGSAEIKRDFSVACGGDLGSAWRRELLCVPGLRRWYLPEVPAGPGRIQLWDRGRAGLDSVSGPSRLREHPRARCARGAVARGHLGCVPRSRGWHRRRGGTARGSCPWPRPRPALGSGPEACWAPDTPTATAGRPRRADALPWLQPPEREEMRSGPRTRGE